MTNSRVIWVINQFAGTPKSGWGERHYYLASHWVRNGYKVFIISGSYSHMFKDQPKVSNNNYTLEFVSENLTFCWVKIPRYKANGTLSKLFSGFIFSLRSATIGKKIIDTPDFIIVSSPPIFSSLSGYILKKRFKAKKFIFEVRDIWPLTAMYLKNYSKNHIGILIMSLFEKLGYLKSDYIVSLLPNAFEHINKISKNPDKFRYIPNGIDKSLIGNDNLPEDILESIPRNKFIIGYTGTIGMANALEFLIEASRKIKKNTNIHFVIVGSGYLREKFINQTSDQSNITFIDKIPKSQVQNMISFFDVCYIGRYGSKLYDFGVSYNKYFDYMLARKPILESSFLIRDQVELSGCGIIVPPEDSNAIIEGINKLKRMPKSELDKLGVMGYKYVMKYHRIEYLSNMYIKLFHEN